MNFNNEQRCKDLGLIPIKEISFGYNNKFVVNFNCDYGIKIIDHDKRLYDIVSLKCKDWLYLQYNFCKNCYYIYNDGERFYLKRNQIYRYINKYLKGSVVNGKEL